MNKYTKGSETKNNNVEKTLKSISVSKDFSFAVYFIHIVLFILASIYASVSVDSPSSSEDNTSTMSSTASVTLFSSALDNV